QRQARGLVAGGVDGFILETFSDVDEIHEALRAVRSVSDLPVIAQMTIGDDGLTHYGTGPETFAKQLTAWGADAVGVNCSVGPAGVLEAVERLVKATDRPISAVPNAGLPKDVGATPMLQQCRALKAAGVDAVNVPDGPRAQSRMGVLPSAILIQKEVGIETVIHYCCRDRNLLGMLSDILGAHAAGLRNIL